MRYRVALSVMLVLPALLAGVADTAWADAYQINPNQRYQAIEGFGTALAWWNNDEYRNPAWQQAYFQDLGSTILRMDITLYAAHTAQGSSVVNLNSTPLIFDGTANDVAQLNFGYDSLVTAGQVAQAGQTALGSDFKLIGAVWSPPHWMKTDAGIVGQNSAGGYLTQTADNRQQYAYYLAAYVKGFEQNFGVPLYGITIQNEPRVGLGYNSSVLEPQWYHDTFLAVAQEFANQGITTKLFGAVQDQLRSLSVSRPRPF
ncbi:MAG: hypothetical protein WD042_08325, partial [Phycisphaeraceae bacterium]